MPSSSSKYARIRGPLLSSRYRYPKILDPHRHIMATSSGKRSSCFAWSLVAFYVVTVVFMAADMKRLTRFHETLWFSDTATGNRHLLVEGGTTGSDSTLAVVAPEGNELQEKEGVDDENTLFHCAKWNEEDMDEWWHRHPDWESHGDNETHTCFRPIQNAEKAAFLRKLHSLLLKNGCSSPEQDYHWEDELEESILNMAEEAISFIQEEKEDLPFPVTFPTNCSSSMDLFARELWACNFLPVGYGTSSDEENVRDCHDSITEPWSAPIDASVANDTDWEQEAELQLSEEQQSWVYSYLLRPRQALRHNLQRILNWHDLLLGHESCIWMHLPTEEGNAEELLNAYLDAAGLWTFSANETTAPPNILLLSDDSTLSEEIASFLNFRWFFPEYPENWFLLTRVDPALALLLQLKLAPLCETGLFSSQNDAMDVLLQNAMKSDRGLENYALIPVGIPSPSLEDVGREGDWKSTSEAEVRDLTSFKGFQDGLPKGWKEWLVYCAKLWVEAVKYLAKGIAKALRCLGKEGIPLMKRAFATIGRNAVH